MPLRLPPLELQSRFVESLSEVAVVEDLRTPIDAARIFSSTLCNNGRLQVSSEMSVAGRENAAV